MKMLLTEEGPYELEINKLFTTEPLASNPRNRCVHLLDVIELPDDPPEMPLHHQPNQSFALRRSLC